jgi:DDE superfamily endonuclease
VKIIHADEAMFTFNTFVKRSWSTAYNSVKVTDQKITVKTMAVIAGISEDVGLETYMIVPKAIKTEEYLQFLGKLSSIYPDQRIILFIDNLSVHKTLEARAAYQTHRITPVFNVPYSP